MSALLRGEALRRALLALPDRERDGWIDAMLGLGELPDDGDDLPSGCVPYLPSPVDALLEATERAAIGPDDLFIDVGSGLGRALAIVHLLTGAKALGVEAQRELVRGARALAGAISPDIETVHADAGARPDLLARGSVFFLYCPFSGPRIDAVLTGLELAARSRPIRVCALDMTLPPRPWLRSGPVEPERTLTIYQSSTVFHFESK